MSDKDKIKYLQKREKKLIALVTDLAEALKIAGKYARDNPPPEIPTDKTYFSILAGGVLRDPDGIEYIDYWLNLSHK